MTHRLLAYIIFILFGCSLVSCTNGKTGSSTQKFNLWKERIVDDFELSNGLISGGDGLVMADLDNDGFEDIISVHESDWKYDGIPRGHLRIAYGSRDPDKWHLVTLGEGKEVGGIEDVAVADINNDGYLDVIGACELSHIIYFQNPGTEIRSRKWERIIPNITLNRGSFIRVFATDLDNDGKVEIVTANKGSQTGFDSDTIPRPISYFEILGDPLNDTSWRETELLRVLVPINSQPVDIDNDGDMDVIAGARGSKRIILMENISEGAINFLRHEVNIQEGSNVGTSNISGFNMDYIDINKDGLLDIILADGEGSLLWLEHPNKLSEAWVPHLIGDISPDLMVGFIAADINNDGLEDFMIGSYSLGSRTSDGNVTAKDKLGCLAWFEHPNEVSRPWIFHPIVRRKRGMFDKFIARDMDKDGDVDFIATRGNSHPFDGVFWLENIIVSENPNDIFLGARKVDSQEIPFPIR